jgi:hypothetical protein
MERIRKRKGSIIMKHYFRILKKEHSFILKQLNYYKNEYDNN